MAEPQKPRPWVEGSVLRSSAQPRLRLTLDPAFTFAGQMEWLLKGVADCERYLFVVAPQRHIERLFVVQFEGFIAANTHRYRYSAEFLADTQPLVLGGQTYRHNTWFYDDAAEGRDEPGAESDRTRAFLQAQGYHLDDELLMSRFDRIVGADHRREVLLFYFENVRATGYTLADLAPGGRAADQAAPIAAALTARSLASFTLA